MAHRNNVIPVKERVEPSEESKQVRDPSCGRIINSRDSKNMVFRGEEVIYFCSPECEMKFLYAKRKAAS